MFDLNFISEPGIQTESSEASWSFLQRITEPETKSAPKSAVVGSKKSGENWKYYNIAATAIIIIAVIGLLVNSQPKVSEDMVLNQVIDFIVESDYMKDLQLAEVHFNTDLVTITITATELDFLQDFILGYQKEDKISYEIFQKNKLNYVSLNFPWEGEKKGGDIETLKTLADKIVFSNNISISIRDDEFELQGSYSDIISYLLQMANNGLIQKFSLLVQHLESGIFYLKVGSNKI